jgi:hypothetical protein
MMASKRKRQTAGSEASLKRTKSGADAEQPDVPAATASAPGAIFTVSYPDRLPSGAEERSNGADISRHPWASDLKGTRRHELDVNVAIKPSLDWSNMKQYSNCLSG